jgi:hypothetical protein
MKKIKKYVLVVALVSCSNLLLGCASDSDDESAMPGIVSSSEFNFRSEPFAEYSRIDRSAMPVIATALIANDDAYNAADPVDDNRGAFATDIITSLMDLHLALDDQLLSRELTPCTVVGDGSGSCVEAAGPLIFPDTIKVDLSADAGFPNGRLLTDPVVDVILAFALLELSGDPAPHSANELLGVLNPTENDQAFLDVFPFLAAPN